MKSFLKKKSLLSLSVIEIIFSLCWRWRERAELPISGGERGVVRPRRDLQCQTHVTDGKLSCFCLQRTRALQMKILSSRNRFGSLLFGVRRLSSLICTRQTKSAIRQFNFPSPFTLFNKESQLNEVII